MDLLLLSPSPVGMQKQLCSLGLWMHTFTVPISEAVTFEQNLQQVTEDELAFLSSSLRSDSVVAMSVCFICNFPQVLKYFLDSAENSQACVLCCAHQYPVPCRALAGPLVTFWC